jgi:hypothetical protein
MAGLHASQNNIPWNELALPNFSAARFFGSARSAKLCRNTLPANAFRHADGPR